MTQAGYDDIILPTWLYPGEKTKSNGYWISDLLTTDSYNALCIYNGLGFVVFNDMTSEEYMGTRPVITINKSYIVE